MKTSVIILVYLSFVIYISKAETPKADPEDEPYWNILSLDGGGIRGLITA